jgi:hypothetical protein
MTVRDIQRHLHELYRIEVPPDLISRALRYADGSARGLLHHQKRHSQRR